MNEPSPRAHALAEAALHLPLPQRTAYLHRACGGDAQLRQCVEQLLATRQLPGPERETLASEKDGLPSAAASQTTLASAPAPETPGALIGRYKILEQIGEGGFGVVYVAEQREPVKRRVALKIIKLGMDTKQVVGRFEAERQALALMDHPNIAKVLDAGATETGRPYFVMELVRGIKITDYCDQNQLPTAQRLDLFVQICHAIQHAHQKGIIHRDIKPSNILVTLHDGKPVPKVIDFGIAKATQGELTDKTIYTSIQQFIGTPAYMSPEQAEMSALDIDTRTDIYSLGVLLYELLTGKTPFESKRLISAGLDEIRRIIRDEEPPRPSTRLSKLGPDEQTTAAKRRQSEPNKLIHLLRGDLDWIAMKCLEKDRTRRYDTANGLAMDVERHLNHEPVLARSPSTLYRFKKTVSRHKLAFAATTCVVAALVLGTGGIALQYMRATRAELAQTQLKLAARTSQAEESQQRRRAEAAIQQLAAQGAHYFDSQDSSIALAYLAHVLRKSPTNRLVAERILSALTHRSFPLPVIEPLHHAGPVNRAVFSPNGERVATASDDQTALIWDARTGQELVAPLQHNAAVTWVEFSPDGSLLATASADGLARIWNASTGKPLADPLRHDSPVHDFDVVPRIHFSPDGKRVMTISFNGTARIWDGASGQRLGELVTQGSQSRPAIAQAQFSPEGSRELTIANDGHAWIWEGFAGKLLTDVNTGDYFATAGRFSPDGNWLALGSANGVTVLDVHSGLVAGEKLKVYRKGPISCLEFSPDGQRLAAASSDGAVQLWDTVTRQPLSDTLHLRSAVIAVHFSPNGDAVLTACSDGMARLWDAQSGQPLSEPMKHGGSLNSAQFSPDGQRVLTASSDGSARIWDVRPGQALTRLLLGAESEATDHIVNLRFSPDGQKLLTDSAEGICIWERASLRRIAGPFAQPSAIRNPANPYSKVRPQFSPDGLLVAASPDRSETIQIWSGLTGAAVSTPIHVKSLLTAISFSHDAKRLVSGSQNGSAQIWETSSGRPLTGPLLHDTNVITALFSADDRQVLTAAGDVVRLWDADTGKLLGVKATHPQPINSACFSPDGKSLLTASMDQSARIWDAATGKQRIEPLNHFAVVLQASFSPDGKRILTVAADRAARIWDAATGQALTNPLRHDQSLIDATFSRDGNRILTASLNGELRVWDAASGEPLTDSLGQGSPIISAELSPDGQWIAPSAPLRLTTQDASVAPAWESQQARLWEIPPAEPPIPPWFAELAEAVAGLRITDQGLSQEVPSRKFMKIRSDFQTNQAPGAWTRWANWFSADRAERKVSPSSSMGLPEYVRRLIERNDAVALEEAIKLAPANALAFARLSFLRLSPSRASISLAPEPSAAREALFYSRRAVELSGSLGEAWIARMLALRLTGEPLTNDMAALGPVAQARGDQDSNLRKAYSLSQGWVWETAGQPGPAIQSYTEAINGPGDGVAAVQARLQALLSRSELYRKLGRSAEFQADYEKALLLSSPKNANEWNDLAWGMVMGPLEKREPERAVLLAERAVRLALSKGPFSGPMSSFYNTLGLVCYRAGQFPKAIESLLAASRLNPGGGLYSSSLDFLPLAMCFHQQGEAVSEKYYLARALQAHRERPSQNSGEVNTLLQEAEQLLGPTQRPSDSNVLSAIAFRSQGNFVESEHGYQEAIAAARAAPPGESPATVVGLLSLAQVLGLQHKWDQAEASNREAQAILSKLLGEEAEELADVFAMIGVALQNQAKLTEAEAAFRRALAIRRKHVGEEQLALVPALADVAAALQSQGNLDEAEKIYRQALDTREQWLGDQHPDVAASLLPLSVILRLQQKLAEADAAHDQALAIWRKQFRNDDVQLGTSFSSLARALHEQGRFLQAEPLFRESLALREKTMPDSWLTFNIRGKLGSSLLGQGKFAEAEQWLLSGYEGMQKRELTIPAGSPLMKEAAQELVVLYQRTNRPEQAARWQKTVKELDARLVSK